MVEREILHLFYLFKYMLRFWPLIDLLKWPYKFYKKPIGVNKADLSWPDVSIQLVRINNQPLRYFYQKKFVLFNYLNKLHHWHFFLF